ncbi:nitric oxide synthase oxygenase [Paenibacillus peoriae]|uniref:nitric oxide synthase oxygenase n=1 Tax=Paenibacillus peoriae TaxID=59893 RepID=UPI00026C63B6|nr:nitric oxide synthase oxygenase [Paenibacillus peoriae]MEC0184372.1 nitric oxide synthase oxygenase [Paenibacillus peoriae]
MEVKQQLLHEAEQFIYTCYEELGRSRDEAEARLLDICHDIETTGTYDHTFEELEHGALMAWRNSNRCIGRLFWDKLLVRDARNASDTEEVANELLEHIRIGTNGGKIKPTLTVFRASKPGLPDIRIWNHQLIRYAGYETDEGVIGDPISLDFTKACRDLGWQGAMTPFDILPLVVEAGEQPPKLFEIPKHLVLEVSIEHPELSDLASLGLRWYAVPMIADMTLEIGGIVYTAAPFNGWYMETEIGARNFADTFRYNMLPQVAELMGLDTTSETTLWRDRALVELNIAVLHSFKKAGVSIVDHHTAAAQFRLFEEREAKAGRELTGDWTWLIPPLSPAATHIFHSSYDNRLVKPKFGVQEKPYLPRQANIATDTGLQQKPQGCPFHSG